MSHPRGLLDRIQKDSSMSPVDIRNKSKITAIDPIDCMHNVSNISDFYDLAGLLWWLIICYFYVIIDYNVYDLASSLR